MDRNIIHMDLDAFFVAVECKLNPTLKGKPVIVGGSNRRGVVAACSYEARKFGVHSAMPMYQAMQLCPEAIVVSGSMASYSQHSHDITEIIAEQAPLFEKASIDEFYIDASGMDKFFGAYKWATELRRKIIRESGLTISMAMSVNKLVSKVASAEFKPNAERQIAPGTERDFFAPLAIDKLPMVGKQTTSFLRNMGVYTVQELRAVPQSLLVNAFGKSGIGLCNKANAIDNSCVVPHTEQKSISTETTFDSDSLDVKRMKSILIAMVEKVAFELRKQKKLTSCIAVKIRYANFDTETKQMQIAYTASDHTILKIIQELFSKAYKKDQPLRLIGVRLSNLVFGNYQISLFDDAATEISLYEELDYIKHRYGIDKIVRATTLGVNSRIRMQMNMFNGKIAKEMLQEQKRF